MSTLLGPSGFNFVLALFLLGNRVEAAGFREALLARPFAFSLLTRRQAA
ncbi:MAG: hypothetical protein OXG03_05085 [Gammaproteobacteria bacterium]|nr:hypothetical protein [Gammaproteobacteria bacterium]